MAKFKTVTKHRVRCRTVPFKARVRTDYAAPGRLYPALVTLGFIVFVFLLGALGVIQRP